MAEASHDKPDLTNGVPENDLDDGAMLVGQVGEEAVLLARRGREVFAIGATCTHYGGPLGEGLMVEDTVRCPGITPALACAPARLWRHQRLTPPPAGEPSGVMGASSCATGYRKGNGRCRRSRAPSRDRQGEWLSSAAARPVTPRPKCCVVRAMPVA
jgi:hypothetical protein